MKLKIIYTLAVILQVYKLIKVKKTIKYYQKLINKITSLDVLSIKQLRNKLSEGIYKIGDSILCYGNVKSSQKISSILEPKKSVVYSQLIMEKVFQFGDSRNSVTRPIRKLFAGFLKLCDNDQHIKIFQTVNSDIICDHVRKKKISFREKIFNFGWLVSILLRSPTRVVSHIYQQSYIPQDSNVTVFAKVSKSSLNEIQIYRPMAIASSKQNILRAYQTFRQNNKYLSYLLYFTIVVSCYFLLKQIIVPLMGSRGMINRKKNQFNQLQKIQVKDYDCSVCHNKLSNIINKPCGHLAVCSDCNSSQNICLECNKSAKQFVTIYPC